MKMLNEINVLVPILAGNISTQFQAAPTPSRRADSVRPRRRPTGLRCRAMFLVHFPLRRPTQSSSSLRAASFLQSFTGSHL